MKNLLIFFFLLILVACSKDNSSDESTIDIVIKTEKTDYQPLEIVNLQSSTEIFAGATILGKINDIDITLESNENTASFILPDLENGTYNCTFSMNQKNYSIPIKVVSNLNISTPLFYFNQFNNNLASNITVLNNQINNLQVNTFDQIQINELKADVIKFTNLKNEFELSYNNLSASEKLVFAKTMSANKHILEQFENFITTYSNSTASLRTSSSVDDYEEKVKLSSVHFVTSVVHNIAIILAIAVTIKIIGTSAALPYVTAGATVTLVGLFAGFIVLTKQNIIAMHQLLNKTFQVDEINDVPTQNIYLNAAAKLESFTAKYRTLINDDQNDQSSGVISKKIIKSYNKLKDDYNDLINILPGFLKPSFNMPAIKSTFSVFTRTIHNKYIKISNCSNPNVILEKENLQNGSYTVKAINSNAITQNFTYQIKYDNSDFGTALSKTVSASVSGGLNNDLLLLTGGSTKRWKVIVSRSNSNDVLGTSIIKYTFNIDNTYTKTFNGNAAAGGTFGFDQNNNFYFNASTNLFSKTLTSTGFRIQTLNLLADPQLDIQMIPN